MTRDIDHMPPRLVAGVLAASAVPRPGLRPPPAAVPPYRWLMRTSAVVLCILLGTLLAVPSEHQQTAGLAVLNLALAGGLSWLTLHRNATLGMLAVAYLAPLVVQTSLSTLYFCVFNPTFGVTIASGVVRLLPNNERFQLATMLYVLAFAIGWSVLAPKPSRNVALHYESWRAAAQRICMPAFAAFTLIVAMLVLFRVGNIGFETGPGYVMYGLFRYCLGLPLLCGASWKNLGWPARTLVTGVLLINGAFSIITNNRSYGFLPFVFLGIGLLFMSNLSTRHKFRFLVVLIALFSFLLVAGDAGRRLNLGIWYGGLEDLAHRFDVISQNSESIVDTRYTWADAIFARLFTMGGFQSTTMMPESVSFKPFYPIQYGLEIVSQGFLPRNVANWLVPPVYEEKSSLVAFGHRLVAGRHSVERHCVGAAWEMGGFTAELFIGLLTGSILGLWTRILAEVAGKAPRLAVVYFAIGFDRMLGAVSEGVPSMLHDLVYLFPVGLCIYAIVWLVAQLTPPSRIPARGMTPMSVSMPRRVT